jgi:hypothetical protein
MRHSAETDAVFPHAYSFKDGVLQLAERLGHRVEPDKPLAAKYCESAWNKDPVFGVIGIQSGPRG